MRMFECCPSEGPNLRTIAARRNVMLCTQRHRQRLFEFDRKDLKEHTKEECAQSVASLHAFGLVHQDLKPSKFLIDVVSSSWISTQ